MSAGLDNLKHIVVLMMGGRSFDHMLGALTQKYPKVNGLTGKEFNLDTAGARVEVQPDAELQGQLDPMPNHQFAGVDLQIFGGAAPSRLRVANMQGFVKDYFSQTKDVRRSHNIMRYFTPDKLPVLTTLATEFALFNGWFSSVPGPTVCNRAFAHYGTSFGQIGMDLSYNLDRSLPSIYERLIQQGRTAKLYYYDSASPIFAPTQLLKDRPGILADHNQFMADCVSGRLPDYSFIEPCHNDHTGASGGRIPAADQHPDHSVQAGEQFIGIIYNAIRTTAVLWQSTALLIVYDHHGGIYDHVVPPACTPDGYTASPQKTGTGAPFSFDRLGVRVPAVLVSPWIPRGTVVPGTENPNPQIFEHASIPCTITNLFLTGKVPRTIREENANTFLGVLGDQLRPDDDCVIFNSLAGPLPPDMFNSDRPASDNLLAQVAQLREAEQRLEPDQQSGTDIRTIKTEGQAADYIRAVTAKLQTGSASPRSTRMIAGFNSDVASGEDLLGITSEVESLCSVIAAIDVEPPISIGLFGDWGTGKTFFMQRMELELNFISKSAQLATGGTAYCKNIVQLWFNAWHYADANLWASLVSHIFEGLAEYVSPSEDNEQTRTLLLSNLQTAKELRAEAERQRARAVQQREETETALKQLAERRAETEAKLTDLRLFDLQLLLETDPELKRELEQTLSSIGFPAAMKSVASLETTLKDAHTLGGRIRTAFVLLWQSKNRETQIILLALILFGFPALSWLLRVWLPDNWQLTRLEAVWSEISVIAISTAATLRKYLAKGSEYLSTFEAARRRIGQLMEAKKQEKSTQELKLEKELNEIKAKESSTSKQFSDAQAGVREIEAKIREIDEGRSLSKFLLERVHADDYRKHLGIISSIRKDFETMNKLWARGAKGPSGPLPSIDRIVLYVDDLDRCRERTVVEVLEAIHLLLFFPLFVVVVGVDSRWLLHSLKQRSGAFQEIDKSAVDGSPRERSDWQFGPLNYLEKIFQIPYSLRPMEETGFQKLMNNLTQTTESSVKIQNPTPEDRSDSQAVEERLSHVSVESPVDRIPASAPKTKAGSPPTPPPPVERTLGMRPFLPNPRLLRLEECERRLMRELYPLIPSPRAAKRTANVYRLLRCSITEEDLKNFVRPDETGEYRAAQLLLAIQVGYPDQAEQIISDLVVDPVGLIHGKWWDFVGRRYKDLAEPSDTSESRRWRAFLTRLTSLRSTVATNEPCDDFIKWAPRVARFSFRFASPVPAIYDDLIKRKRSP